jgi:hypothetical protein
MSLTTKAIHVGEYVLVRHAGTTRDELVEARSSAKKILNEQRWNRLLIDMRGVEGRVSVTDAYYSMEAIARELSYARIGLVFPPEREEEGRFAETVATNRGVQLKAFTDYEQAVGWLTEKQPDQVCGGSG